MKIHKHKHAWKQPSKMVLPYLSAAMYKSSGPESPNDNVLIPSPQNLWKIYI